MTDYNEMCDDVDKGISISFISDESGLGYIQKESKMPGYRLPALISIR